MPNWLYKKAPSQFNKKEMAVESLQQMVLEQLDIYMQKEWNSTTK
jgi:hypothetical protein